MIEFVLIVPLEPMQVGDELADGAIPPTPRATGRTSRTSRTSRGICPAGIRPRDARRAEDGRLRFEHPAHHFIGSLRRIWAA